MAIWLEVERRNGKEDRIPALNLESIEFVEPIVSVKVIREVISTRGDLACRKYRGYDITNVIPNLRKGDKIRVSTLPKSYSERTLTVTQNDGERVDGEEFGTEFHLLKRYWGPHGQAGGNPWLRTADGFESRGEIEEIEILSLSDNS